MSVMMAIYNYVYHKYCFSNMSTYLGLWSISSALAAKDLNLGAVGEANPLVCPSPIEVTIFFPERCNATKTKEHYHLSLIN